MDAACAGAGTGAGAGAGRDLAQRWRAAARALPVDSSGFLGISEAEMTPVVRGALQTLLSEIDDLRGEVAKLQQAWEAESAGLRASLRGAEAQVKSHADDARAAAATHDALLGSGSSGSVSSPP